MVDQIKILALVPAYNPDVRKLNESINSLLGQTIKPDILIVDDGSKFDISAICPEDPCIFVLRAPENRGITAALILGVEWAIARGYDYICRLDIGDVSYPERVAVQLAYMQQRPALALVGGKAEVITTSGEALFVHGVEGRSSAIRSYCYNNAPFKHSTFFLRVGAIREHGNYDPSLKLAQDYGLVLRLASRGLVEGIPNILIRYEDDPSGISATRRKEQLLTRLRLQRAYARPLNFRAIIGIVRTVVLLLLPFQVAKTASKLRWGRGK